MLLFVTLMKLTNSKQHSHRQSAYSSMPHSRVVVLAEQLLQSKAPALCLYVPISHATHRPMSGPVNSGLQMQALTDVLAVGLLVFGAHLIHGELPLTAFHSPVAHALHGPLLGQCIPDRTHSLSVLYCLRRRAMHWDMIVLADHPQDSNSFWGTTDKTPCQS